MTYIEMSTELKFLIVDSSPGVREILQQCLKKLGYRNIFQCLDGVTALETLERESIGFLICERNLPQLSGMEFLKEIREMPRLNRVPFMMMASEISKEDVVLASEFGIDGYLKKPFMMKDLIARISTCMARYVDVNNPEISFDAAREAFMAGDYAVSLARYEDTLKILPGSARVQVGMARCFKAQQQIPKAKEALLEAIKTNELYVHAYHELGLIFLAENNVEEALRLFAKAISVSPGNPVRYEAVADILMRAGKYQEAEDYLTKAVKLELVYPVLYEQLGKTLFAQKKVDRALQYFEKALRKQPDNTSYLNSMGICMKEMGRYEEGITYYNRALKIRPSDVKILFNKALCFLLMEQFDRSRKTCQQILKIDPQYEKAKNKLIEVDKLEEIYKKKGAKKAG